VTERRISIAFQTDQPLAAYGSLAAAAERHGFDVVSVYNDLLYQPAWLPLLEIARATRRVALGPAAVNPFTCHPVNIAGHAGLIDEASGGRAYLGLARGAWLDFLDVQPARPVRALREAFECVRHLLRRSREPYHGEVFRLTGGDSLRWTIARPELPFLLGIWGVATIRACIGEISEVKVGGTANPHLVARYLGEIDAAAAGAGREAGEVGLAFGCVSVVDRDGRAARDLARRKAALYVGVIADLDPTLGVEPGRLARIRAAAAADDFDAAAREIPDALLARVALAGTPDDVAAQADALYGRRSSRFAPGSPGAGCRPAGSSATPTPPICGSHPGVSRRSTWARWDPPCCVWPASWPTAHCRCCFRPSTGSPCARSSPRGRGGAPPRSARSIWRPASGSRWPTTTHPPAAPSPRRSPTTVTRSAH
jgi:5,10-methylenetetrahydromethanopterin reductase